ncbi:aldose 1-epimerase family protein [Flavobacterium sp. MFBS3-15]|uniref:aldose 1-epimerase family protein n=1 Tax=Flavobacterium sp. MFBS3-15 TaxID=2989816 RepID=UPI0022364B1A|nr:aldose 1-epimerase family protein [Flavobacterium sp. MFBS3-15]MCW4470741.1 aldose 1-epimerase family protein [Flavobacterium sp. MFBS3-15]
MDVIIKNGKLTATIDTRGAELKSLKNSEGKEYMWDGNPEFWGKHSPVLFPIVGTLRNNSYLFEGRQYGMTRHGFARDSMFTVKEEDESHVVFLLSSHDDTRRVYPFDFDLELTYILNDNTLHIYYTVTNRGTGNMPFSIGAHPAFALTGNFEDYSLIFENDEKPVSTQLENDLLSTKTVSLPVEDKTLPLSYDLFKDDALILKDHTSRSLEVAKNGKPFLKVAFSDFPHLGIWTKENAPFVCIEPWQGYSDTQNATGNLVEKEGMVNLSAAEKYRAGFSIIILS